RVRIERRPRPAVSAPFCLLIGRGVLLLRADDRPNSSHCTRFAETARLFILILRASRPLWLSKTRNEAAVSGGRSRAVFATAPTCGGARQGSNFGQQAEEPRGRRARAPGLIEGVKSESGDYAAARS